MTGTPPPFIFRYMDKVAEELNGINKTLEKILNVMEKPENKTVNTLEIVVLVVAALGFINIIDTVLSWVRGG